MNWDVVKQRAARGKSPSGSLFFEMTDKAEGTNRLLSTFEVAMSRVNKSQVKLKVRDAKT